MNSVVTLAGQGASATTINGNGIDRVPDVLDHGNLTIRNLNVTGGHAPNGTPATGAVPGTPAAAATDPKRG